MYLFYFSGLSVDKTNGDNADDDMTTHVNNNIGGHTGGHTGGPTSNDDEPFKEPHEYVFRHEKLVEYGYEATPSLPTMGPTKGSASSLMKAADSELLNTRPNQQESSRNPISGETGTSEMLPIPAVHPQGRQGRQGKLNVHAGFRGY